MPSISRTKLETLLRQVNCARMVSFTSVTKPELLQRGNPWAKTARKVTIGQGVICWQYSAAVDRQQIREGKPASSPRFRALPRSWGQRIQRTPLVVFVNADGETLLYLEIKIERRTEHYFDNKTRRRIDFEAISPFIPQRKESARQQLERQILLRDYKLQSLAELTIDGIRYTIAPAVTELRKYFPRQSTPAAAKPARSQRTTTQRRKSVKGAS